mmetsp:Transcript_30815/g.77184  ORF Transcript_30815/g.77184 Transcript_30815/m.77184 type:complete len:222 (-) Transcript_30815:1493-2158(-)
MASPTPDVSVSQWVPGPVAPPSLPSTPEQSTPSLPAAHPGLTCIWPPRPSYVGRSRRATSTARMPLAHSLSASAPGNPSLRRPCVAHIPPRGSRRAEEKVAAPSTTSSAAPVLCIHVTRHLISSSPGHFPAQRTESPRISAAPPALATRGREVLPGSANSADAIIFGTCSGRPPISSRYLRQLHTTAWCPRREFSSLFRSICSVRPSCDAKMRTRNSAADR